MTRAKRRRPKSKRRIHRCACGKRITYWMAVQRRGLLRGLCNTCSYDRYFKGRAPVAIPAVSYGDEIVQWLEADDVGRRRMSARGERRLIEATARVRRGFVRNPDARTRELERRWRASGSEEYEALWLQALVRSGEATARQARRLRIIREQIRRGVREVFVSFQQLYELYTGPHVHGRDRKVESIDEDCSSWAINNSHYDTDRTVEEFERDHDVELTDEQKEAIRSWWDTELQDACYRAYLSHLRGVADAIEELLNEAAKAGRGLDEDLDRHVRGPQQPAVLGWREGHGGPDGEPGVWFALTRAFLFASVEARWGVYRMAAVDGEDVLGVARSWAGNTGATWKLRVPRSGVDPTNFVEWPRDADLLKAVREVGPLRRRDEEPERPPKAKGKKRVSKTTKRKRRKKGNPCGRQHGLPRRRNYNVKGLVAVTLKTKARRPTFFELARIVDEVAAPAQEILTRRLYLDDQDPRVFAPQLHPDGRLVLTWRVRDSRQASKVLMRALLDAGVNHGWLVSVLSA